MSPTYLVSLPGRYQVSYIVYHRASIKMPDMGLKLGLTS